MDKKDVILQVKDLKTEFKVSKRTVHAVNGVSFDLQRGKTSLANQAVEKVLRRTQLYNFFLLMAILRAERFRTTQKPMYARY